METAKPHQPRPEDQPRRVLICARCGISGTTLHKIKEFDIPGQELYTCFPNCQKAADRVAMKALKLKHGLTKKGRIK